VQCDACHTTNGWLPVTRYSHTSGNYPGDHRTSVTCVRCHTSNTQTATWKSGGYKPYCAGCHAGDFEPGEHRKIDSPSVYYTVSELKDCAGACHRYTDSSMSTTSRTRNSKHHPGDGDW
jgi:hypothetical protein